MKFKDYCNYWRYNLSKGRSFYGSRKHYKDFVWLIINRRVFRIAKSVKCHSYYISEAEMEVLLTELNAKGISYTFCPEEYEQFQYLIFEEERILFEIQMPDSETLKIKGEIIPFDTIEDVNDFMDNEMSDYGISHEAIEKAKKQVANLQDGERVGIECLDTFLFSVTRIEAILHG